MHVWWAKQEDYSDELDDLEEAAAEAAEKATAKATANVGAAEGGEKGESAPDTAAKEVQKKPLSAEARLEKARKDASTALSKEKKSR